MLFCSIDRPNIDWRSHFIWSTSDPEFSSWTHTCVCLDSSSINLFCVCCRY